LHRNVDLDYEIIEEPNETTPILPPCNLKLRMPESERLIGSNEQTVLLPLTVGIEPTRQVQFEEAVPEMVTEAIGRPDGLYRTASGRVVKPTKRFE